MGAVVPFHETSPPPLSASSRNLRGLYGDDGWLATFFLNQQPYQSWSLGICPDRTHPSVSAGVDSRGQLKVGYYAAWHFLLSPVPVGDSTARVCSLYRAGGQDMSKVPINKVLQHATIAPNSPRCLKGSDASTQRLAGRFTVSKVKKFSAEAEVTDPNGETRLDQVEHEGSLIFNASASAYDLVPHGRFGGDCFKK